jgi:hypothetical protein
MSTGLPHARPGRCLGPELSAYADRSLCPEELTLWDRHLVACTACRCAVESERRMLAALRSPATPALPSALRASLLSLATAAEPAGPRQPASPRRSGLLGAAAASPVVPPVPRRTGPGAAAPPLPVVPRSAPALHRSPVRATVFAGLAAGATAAAAWSLAVVGAPLGPTVPGGPAGTAQRPARPAAPSPVGASLAARPRAVTVGVPVAPVARPGRGVTVQAVSVLAVPFSAPVVRGRVAGSAQSMP